MFGITTSSTTRSYGACASAASASAPDEACIAWYPWLTSKSASSFALAAVSSTTRMRGTLSTLAPVEMSLLVDCAVTESPRVLHDFIAKIRGGRWIGHHSNRRPMEERPVECGA